MNASALDYRVTALRLLSSTALPGEGGAERKRQSIQTRLNETFHHYLGLHRVNDSAVFAADREVAVATHVHAPNVSTHLVAADARLANTAVADAERALARLNAQNRSVDTSEARTHIRKARRAIQQAEHLQKMGSSKAEDGGNGKVDDNNTNRHGKSKWGSRTRGNDNGQAASKANHTRASPAAIITHYRRAWTEAQYALDLLDREVAPTVTITKRADPVHNGTINYTVQGTVFDVRTHAVELTVSVNGEARTTRLIANATPATTGQFAIVVSLDQQVNEITVTATDPGEPVSRLSEPWPAQSARDTLRLDSDGLPDHYEQNVTETDPLDSDSNATATSANESGDGVPDGEEDFDADSLSTIREHSLGTNPVDADTDDDDLVDGFELFVTDTDPLNPDTDDDGTPDGAEDPDEDGLTTAEEATFGSDPTLADSDGDGLNDSAEHDLGTDPVLADTDADGIDDAAEFAEPFHTDPLDPDTDGDDILDGEETYTTETANETLGTAVSLTGEGDVAGGVTVTNGSRPGVQTAATETARAAPIIEIEARDSFDSADLTLQYDPVEVKDESDLAVFTYDESLGIFVPLASTVDPTNDSVTAEVPHFSTFTVMSLDGWAGQYSALPSRWTVDEAFTSLTDWDCTGSCTAKGGIATVQSWAPPPPDDDSDDGGGGGGTPPDDGGDPPEDGDPCTAENTDPPDNGGCPPPDDDPCTSDVIADPPGGCALANSTIVEPSENTDEPGGGSDRPTASTLTRTIPLPSGAATVRVTVSAAVAVSGSNGSARITLSGANGEQTLFQQSGGGPTPQAEAAGFPTTTRSVAHLVDDSLTITATTENNATVSLDTVRVFVDRDGDGLADPIEAVNCLQTQKGCVELDPTSVDTDGDGLHDDEELGRRVSWFFGSYTVSYYQVSSRPDAVHSDGDGIDDYREDRGWTVNITRTPDGEPLRWKPNSSEEMHVSSDPLEVDTDGDGLSDRVEKEELHTDPSEKITYQITRRHQERVVDRLADAWDAEHYRDGKPTMAVETARAIGVLAPDEPGTRLADLELDDATDDFDFVQLDDGGLAFRALDRTERTDTWLANDQELRFAPRLDPWDPDTDDDGLTDGQELKWITEVEWGYNSRTDQAVLAASPDWTVTFDTEPWDADTDGDGYWDGWLGVYGVENSSNVILYMEHLVDDDPGVTGDEVVVEQAGVHRTNATPSAMGADIYGNGTKYHSNIHIGELHWGAHPVDPADTPTPGLTIEVDFHNQSTPGLWRRDASGSLVSSWADRIEANYALYGIDVTFRPDEVIEDSELQTHEVLGVAPITAPFNIPELGTIAHNFHQTPDTQYFFVANNTDSDPLGTRQTGVNFYFLGNALYETLPRYLNPQGMFVFTENHPHDLARRKTAVHEIAHSFQIGEADDDCSKRLWRGGEFYSGEDRLDTPPDPTPEAIGPVQRWSVMASGWLGSQMTQKPMNGKYFAFSIEELSTTTTRVLIPCI